MYLDNIHSQSPPSLFKKRSYLCAVEFQWCRHSDFPFSLNLIVIGYN